MDYEKWLGQQKQNQERFELNLEKQEDIEFENEGLEEEIERLINE